jgi:LysW-gamma-L-lysine carboxypeptidase
LWNWVTAHAARVNDGKDKVFDQLSPSLRRFVTAATDQMHDTVDAQFAWRVPVGFEAEAFMNEIHAWPATQNVKAQFTFKFRGIERAWKSDRSNALVRSFLAALREEEPSAQLGFVLKSGTSDMNVVAPVWKCPIVAYGPGDSALDHTPNEHLPLEDYWRAVNVIERMLITFSEG